MAVVSPVPVPGPVPGESVLTESDASLLFSGARTAYTFTDEPVTDAQLRAIPRPVQVGADGGQRPSHCGW